MELVKVESLLEAYFEGNTTLEQEETLRSYFASVDVAPQVAMYQPLFAGIALAKEEVSHRELQLPQSTASSKIWWLGIAASAVITLGVAGFMFNQPSLTAEEEEAMAAYRQAQSTMLLLSEGLNKGTASLSHLDEFSKGQEQMAYLNEFTQAKNKILK